MEKGKAAKGLALVPGLKKHGPDQARQALVSCKASILVHRHDKARPDTLKPEARRARAGSAWHDPSFRTSPAPGVAINLHKLSAYYLGFPITTGIGRSTW